MINYFFIAKIIIKAEYSIYIQMVDKNYNLIVK
jgi:hypothetical protein